MTRRPRIYLDHAATTPIRPEAKAAMLEGLERWANPSSPHAEGRAARAALEDARERIKRALGWTGELIFTSGASEAIDIALGRTKRRLLVSAVEHDAVFRAAPKAEILAIGSRGQVQLERLAEALVANEPTIVAIQHVNSETGVQQPVGHYAATVRKSGGLLLSDCSQSAGKIPLPDADIIIVSAHKLGGPPGVGALLVRDFSMLEAHGGQERGYRGGTENLPVALGFAAATDQIRISMDEASEVMADWLRWDADLLHDFNWPIAWNGGVHQPEFVGDAEPNWSDWIWSISMPVLSAGAQLIRFDQMGFAVSAGSACSSGSMKPSRALKAFGVPDDVAGRTIRVSFGWTTTVDEIKAFRAAWLEMAEDVRRRAT